MKFFLFLALFFSTERLCHLATDGFALVNIYAPKEDVSAWATEAPLGEIETVLEQPFHYLNSGSQSYVFLAADGKTVLKFFKFQHMRIPPWIDLLPLPAVFAEKRAIKKEKKRQVLTKTLNSYAIAYEKMQEETGLLFIHLAPSIHLKKSITIYDKIGKKHLIDLDEVEFILQKKADLAYDTLDRWITAGEVEKAKKGVHNLLQLTLSRCQKGILDRDPDFSTNFGFIGEKPMQIDVGRLLVDEKEKNPLIYSKEMVRITRDFQKWIEKNHIDLLEFFDGEVEKIKAQH